MKRFFVASRLTLGAALLLSSGQWLAAADDLPKAETILDKSIEATGGKAAWQKIHNEVSTGSMSVGGMQGTATIYRAEPDKNYTEITFEGIGKMTQGSNGKIAWSNSAMQGPHVKEGDEKESALLEGKFDGELNWRAQYPKVETVGMETIGGKDCYKVILTPKSGNPITRYYDKQSGLMQKMVITVKGPMGEVTMESLLSDYHKEGDILVPHRLTNKAMGQEFVINIDKIQYNADIPPSRFDTPAEIQALLDKEKK